MNFFITLQSQQLRWKSQFPKYRSYPSVLQCFAGTGELASHCNKYILEGRVTLENNITCVFGKSCFGSTFTYNILIILSNLQTYSHTLLCTLCTKSSSTRTSIAQGIVSINSNCTKALKGAKMSVD